MHMLILAATLLVQLPTDKIICTYDDFQKGRDWIWVRCKDEKPIIKIMKESNIDLFAIADTSDNDIGRHMVVCGRWQSVPKYEKFRDIMFKLARRKDVYAIVGAK